MAIREVDVSDRPVCPGCSTRDKVVPLYANDPPPIDALDFWFCSRCVGWLSALPVLPPYTTLAVTHPFDKVEEPAPVEPKKRGRKRKEASE